MRRAISITLALGLAAGCTCAVNPDQYLGGGTDAGPDAMIDAGPVVIPDGGDAGPPLENLPPEPTGAGFDDYQPHLGKRLRLIVGPVRDPNGDPITTEFTWFQNGTEVPAERGADLMLDATRFSVGDEIRVEVGFGDGEEVTVIDVGPALIVDDSQLRWNSLFPAHGGNDTDVSITFDPVHHRILWRSSTRSYDYGLWEFQFSAAGIDGQWVHLENVGGTPPDATGGVFVADPEGGRVLNFGGSVPQPMGPSMSVPTVWALDVTRSQGEESWARLSPTGETPSTYNAATITEFTTSEGERGFLFYGGLVGDDDSMQTPSNELTIFWPERGDSWERISDNLLPSALVLPTPAFDDATGTIYLIGGALLLPTPAVTERIYALDVADLAAGARDTGWTLPQGRFGGSAQVRDGVALYVGGASSLDMMGRPSPAGDLLEIDLADGTVTSRNGSFEYPLAAGAASRAPFANTLLVNNRDFDGVPVNYVSIDPSTGLSTTITGPGVDMPGARMQATGVDRRDPGVIFYGGRTTTDEPIGANDVWYFNGAELQPATLSGTPPSSARWGFQADFTDQFARNNLMVVGGMTDGGALVDDEHLRARANDQDWLPLALRAGQPLPTARVGHSVFRGHCAADPRYWVVGYVGGEVGAENSGMFPNTTWMLECARSGDSSNDCVWFEAATLAQPVRWGATTQLSTAVDQANEHTFLVGGFTPSGPTNRVYYLRACGANPSESWLPVTVDGTLPTGGGHSVTAHPTGDPEGSPRTTEAFMIFGGPTEFGGNPRDTVYRLTWDDSVTAPTITPTLVTPAGDAPPGRIYHTAVYDAEAERIIIYGGLSDGSLLSDLWELRLR